MGKWEEFTKLEKPKPPHVHQKPTFTTVTGYPKEGSVWRCECRQTWKVSKVVGRTSVTSALLTWKAHGDTYALFPFNYDQPNPFPVGGSC